LRLKRLRNFSRLAPSEQALALRAIAWLALARAGLRFIPFNRLHGMMSGRPPSGGARAGADWPRAVRRAVMRAERSLPGSSCLAQSLVAERLLRGGGFRACLTIGVAHAHAHAQAAAAGRVALDAHAWVESAGMVVTGDDPRGRYRVLATFGPE
jgi:hypothetical protein